MNSKLKSVYCIYCKKKLEIEDYPFGCPECLKSGNPSSVTFTYSEGWKIDASQTGMKRYAAMLPYRDFPTLGEGNTPLISLNRLAKELGLAEIYSKNEFQNPTGSHKDRMNPLIIARALDLGLKTVTAATSGNEGVSLACYAAAAGLHCAIVATRDINPIWKTAIKSAGAELIFTSDSKERWEFIRDKMENDGWFSATNVIDPPVGSCSYGVQGYKTISYEIYEQMENNMPDYILVPVARGDLLWGIYEGLADLKKAGKIVKIPHLIAVEPIERLEKVVSVEDCKKHFTGNTQKTPSIGGDTVTIQSKLAIENSGGFAISASQDIEESILDFGRNGLYLEASSALLITCLRELVKENKIPKNSKVVMISTSHGFKNMSELYAI